MRTTYRYFLIFTFLVLGCTQANVHFPIQKGVLDLRSATIDNSFRINLDGDWEFYWQQLLTPNTFQKPHEQQFIHVPSHWSAVTLDKKNLTGMGFGTYRLNILLPPKYPQLSLKLLDISSSHKLWINGVLYAEVGVVSDKAETARPSFKTALYDLPNTNQALELVIQVSNFSDAKGGIWESVKLGSYSAIHLLREYMLTFEALITGSLIIMGFYHIGLFLLRKKDKSTLWFGLLCVVIAFRVLLMGERFLHTIIPYSYWELLLKVEYLSMNLGVIFFLLFLQFLFPFEMPRRALKILFVLTAILMLPILIFPTRVFSRLLVGYEVVILYSVILCIVTLTTAIIRKRPGAFVIALSSFFLAFSVVNDVLYSQKLIFTFQMTGLGLFIFIFSQSFILSMKFSKAFSTNEILSENLTRYNIAYERFVPREFLQYLAKDSILDIELGDQVQADMTIVFIDIRSFTALSEKMTPKENFNFLNNYLGRVSPIIRKYNGFIDKYLGDGFMALFPKRAEDAVLAVLEIQTAVQELNDEIRDKNLPQITIGAGIHTGRLMLGIVGEKERMDGTVISDAVNLASRVEGLNKRFGSTLVISEDTLFQLDDPTRFSFRFLGRVYVQGKSAPVSIFEFYDADPKDVRIVKTVTRTEFEKGVTAYYEEQLDDAHNIFQSILRANPTDRAVIEYLRILTEKKIA